ncbi:hypothetical protein EG329_006404 [Mollisiaceae sp. DMI_Dod_QoI]|nr:hypothetical protein EG329_006404 [Helotiales sp. DMI_Dod_QoI]
MASASRDALQFPESHRALLEPHLPPRDLEAFSSSRPFTTLTFATSLDSQVALAPGVQTALSGPESKAMTHFLRSRHDAILIGVNTAVVDNPSLNCRLDGVGGYGGRGLEGQPRPVIIDPGLRWAFEERQDVGWCKILKLTERGQGRAPFIITAVPRSRIPEEKRGTLESMGGKFISLLPCGMVGENARLLWTHILRALSVEGLHSVMIEGGAGVINEILSDPDAHRMVDSVILTIAPVWLGEGGVVVTPKRRHDQKGDQSVPARLECAKWVPLGQDVVLCGRLKQNPN